MKLHYKKYGESGPVIVIMHGIFGMLDNWHSFASQLGKNFQVYTLDHRNHGRSPHADEFSYEDMVADLDEFINDHMLDNISLIGHSMGGKTAMHYALKYPEKIKKLCVLDIGVKYYPPRHDHIFQALCSLELSTFSSRNEIDEFLSDKINNFSIRQFLIKNIKRKKDGQFVWKMNLPVIRKNYDKIVEWIPTGQSFYKEALFVRGSNSSFILMEDLPGIEEIFPNSSLESIAGASHWLHAEKPYVLLRLLNAFLKEEKQLQSY